MRRIFSPFFKLQIQIFFHRRFIWMHPMILFYSLDFFSCLLRLFYLMCFNLYIKNVNARTDGEMKFDRWWKRQIWRQGFVNVVEHAFSSLSIPVSGNIFFHQSVEHRVGSNIQLDDVIRFFFAAVTTSVCVDSIENGKKNKKRSIILGILTFSFMSFVCLQQKPYEIQTKKYD